MLYGTVFFAVVLGLQLGMFLADYADGITNYRLLFSLPLSFGLIIYGLWSLS
jgi:hypothetical protein